MLRRIALAAMAGWLALLCCCELAWAARPQDSLTVMTYNVMTLFDAKDDGGEYPDFQLDSGRWDELAYRRRLGLLRDAIHGSLPGGPDILVLVEIENASVLDDLAAVLGGYPSRLISPDEEAVLACGILARFPVVRAQAHRACLPAVSNQPRFMLEVELMVHGQPLVVLCCHWKSKLGGAEETEAQRIEAARLAGALVARRLTERPGLAMILAGDLNESPDEYLRCGQAYPTALMPAEQGPGPWLSLGSREQTLAAWPQRLVLYSPWADYGGYSYRYAGLDEQIDHLLLSPGLLAGCGLSFDGFFSQPADFLVNQLGEPIKWLSTNGRGYSDHLPIYARFRF